MAAAGLASGGKAQRNHTHRPKGSMEVFMIARVPASRSDQDFVTEEEFDLIYDQWLWDVPSLLDVAVIYGRANPEATSELFACVANKSYSDWSESAAAMKNLNRSKRCFEKSLTATVRLTDALFLFGCGARLACLLICLPCGVFTLFLLK